MFYCTIGNQFEILMLIEMLELGKIHVIGANTDGILCLFDKSLEDTHNRICEEWEVIVGNNVRGKLEHTYFKALYQESVNHYIAIKEDDSLKIKGRFEIYGELHKNNSDKISRIERLAVQEYFIKGIPVEKTITIWSIIYTPLHSKYILYKKDLLEATLLLAGANINSFVQSNVNYIISTGGAAGSFSFSSVSGMKTFINRY